MPTQLNGWDTDEFHACRNFRTKIYSQTLLFWPNVHIIIIEYSLTPVTILHRSLLTLDWQKSLLEWNSLISCVLEVVSKYAQGYARFSEILQNFSERQILWSLCSVVFLALTLKLSIQTSRSVLPKVQVCARSDKNVNISAKQVHPRVLIE